MQRAGLLQEFRTEAKRLREAAAALDALHVATGDWGPREVLAHITLWAVQAAEHFRLHLPPLHYGNSRIWDAAMFGTFDTAFERLSDRAADAARRSGWEVVARSGVALPLATKETPAEHLRVDEAFNAAAVELVRDRPFEDVLQLTEEAHGDLLKILEQAPAQEYGHDRHLYRRLLLIVQHHVEHRAELERQVAEATA
jgi:hypothetical protein